MDDYISRQAAISEFPEDALPWDTFDGYVAPHHVRKILERLPSAYPETARRIAGKSRDGMTMWYQCDMCKEPVDIQDAYCSGCGRRLTDADD